ncbi:hypothetical protein AAFP32_12130 [Brevibacterium sp. CBA3109]|uniref:Uncharacterized protein n=1 Tax=Brevibacterium koreense TaxID=3140787 RepID=A0AAU7UIE3_9MICO
MIVIEAAQGATIIDLIIGIGGSILVGLASYLAIASSNRNARTMKKDDFRREELNRVAEAMSNTRKTLGHLAVTVDQIGALDVKLREGSAINLDPIEAHILALNEEIREAEAALVHVAFTNPQESVRENAGLTIKAMTEASSVGLHELLGVRGANPKYSEAVHIGKQARKQLERLQAIVTEAYYGDAKPKKRAAKSKYTT